MSDETTPGPDLWTQLERITADVRFGDLLSSEIRDLFEPEFDRRDAEIRRLRVEFEDRVDSAIAKCIIARGGESVPLDQVLREVDAEAAVARVKALADDMRTWCSPHGIAVLYAQRIDDAIEPPEPVGIEADSEAEFAAKLGAIMRKHRAVVHPEHDEACGNCAVIKGAPEVLTAGLGDLPAVRAFAAKHDPREETR